jgi:hypothetical protein
MGRVFGKRPISEEARVCRQRPQASASLRSILMISGPTAIMANALNNSFKSRWLIVLYYTLSLSIVLALMIFASLRSKPVEETITVDSNQAKTLQIAPVPVTNELPRADLDIETAGDHLAAAVIYLKRRQNQTALNALDQAKAATDRALTRRPVDSRVRQQLLATRKEIETVKELIRNGKVVNATQELKDVNLQLDSVTY